jgi:glycosyltransferase involved in cell wall biosynthesis
MQNRVVPVVYDGGGLREIVDHGINGFRVKSKAELLHYSLELFQDEGLVQNLGENAQKKSQEFSRLKFEERIHAFFNRLLSSYNSPD